MGNKLLRCSTSPFRPEQRDRWVVFEDSGTVQVNDDLLYCNFNRCLTFFSEVGFRYQRNVDIVGGNKIIDFVAMLRKHLHAIQRFKDGYPLRDLKRFNIFPRDSFAI